jgi:hypothetical protein
MIKNLVFAVAVLVICCTGCGRADPAVEPVASQIESNKLGITGANLETRKNPRGDGTFVFVRETRFRGVERYFLWLVIDQQAFALNGASKGLTPTLPWPREANAALWQRTGLDPYSPGEAIRILFVSVD